MAYSSTNPLQLYDDGLLGTGPREYVYQSTDSSTVICATAYFIGAGSNPAPGAIYPAYSAGGSSANVGARLGDLVRVVSSTNGSSVAATKAFNGLVTGCTGQISSGTSLSSAWAQGYDISVTPFST